MNIMIFCSNPVNGGTARIFYETVKGIQGRNDVNLYPCVNGDNSVEIYNKIGGLVRLPIVSAETLYKGSYGGNIIRRVFNSFKRSILYNPIKKSNINVVKEFIENNKIDTVLIHNGGYVGDDLCNQVLTAAYKARNFAKKRVYILHNDMQKSWISKVRFYTYDKKITKEATEIATVSKYTRNRIMSNSFIGKDIKIIYNGINVDKKQEQLNQVIVDDSKINILMIGNFLNNKGNHKFIEVAEILSRKNKNVRFTIIGNVYEEDYYQYCREKIREYRIDDLISIYHGINNASDYINKFKMMIVPSLYDESFGLISVEAMAYGVPVIAFECGGIPEVVENERDGYVVAVGNSEEMAEKIEYLIEHPIKWESMKKNCIDDYRNKFSVDSMIGRYVDILEENDERKNI